VVTRIALADRSCLDETKLWRTPVTLAGTTALLPMLVMPTMLDRVILGMDFLRTAKTRVRCGQATLNLQPEPQAVGDPLLLPVLILPRNDRGEGVRPVEFKVQLGTASQGGAEVLSPTATRATATTNDTHTRKDGCERGRRRSTNCTFEPGATRLHRPRVSFVRESPGGIACCRTPYRHARRQTIEAKVLSQEPRDATCHRYPSR